MHERPSPSSDNPTLEEILLQGYRDECNQRKRGLLTRREGVLRVRIGLAYESRDKGLENAQKRYKTPS